MSGILLIGLYDPCNYRSQVVPVGKVFDTVDGRRFCRDVIDIYNLKCAIRKRPGRAMGVFPVHSHEPAETR